VAFFPEGTTVGQGALLPFHSNLFEAAISAKVPIQPYALRYVDAKGQLHPAADFIGDMTFAESVIAILKAGKITAELILLPAIDTAGAHRRELAAAARHAIAAALGRPNEQG
jgi:1-acyl-sn-glycerol-3-phosphate acyltransferase